MVDLGSQGDGMRIQTRLFLGTAALVVVLTATQWWLHRRQLVAIEHELGAVATAVGKGILDERVQVLVQRLGSDDEQVRTMTWVGNGPAADNHGDSAPRLQPELDVVVVPDEARESETGGTDPPLPRWAGTGVGTGVGAMFDAGDGGEPAVAEVARTKASGATGTVERRRIELRVAPADEPGERYLVLSSGSGAEQRIPIPVLPTQRIARETSKRGLAIGAGLLVVGLVASGTLANRLTRPLRRLAAGAEVLGGGELGVQVAEDAGGEVGELQRAFNRMSSRLETLEFERARWLEREQLAQLGDLSRGLAHTLRNPLNALGLAIDELAQDRTDRDGLVTTARAQIRRIDRWLRSFLALGAGDAAAAEEIDLRLLVQDVTLEAIQDGARLAVDVGDRELPVLVVPTALRAAVANLVENAVEASTGSEPVDVTVGGDGGEALIAVADRGPGLPQAVRDRLYSPHVTTKQGGSGMGLFLAQRLIVGMHDGRLEVTDRPGGGTVAEVRLRLREDHGATG